MAKKGYVSMNIDKLKQLHKGLQTKALIQVGVFQDKSARKEVGLTNADLAMYHELGAPEHNLPARSMLKTPIADHAQDIMAPFKGKAEALLGKGTLEHLYKLIGIAAEKIVLGAFKTGGYGKWASLKTSTLMAKLKGNLKKRKGTVAQIYAGQVGEGILKDTGQLQRAFSSRVKMRIGL